MVSMPAHDYTCFADCLSSVILIAAVLSPYSCCRIFNLTFYIMQTLLKPDTLLCVTAISAVAAAAAVHAQDTSNPTDICGFSTEVQFVEGAPRDRFIVQNTSSDAWRIVSLSLDLSSSAGNLIFDITAEGAGVDVFQPFRGDGGEASLTSDPTVTDGDQSLVLDFANFAPGSQYRFSMDVDDQLTNSDLGQIRVSSSEMQGATMTFSVANEQGSEQQIAGAFNEANRIALAGGSC